MMKIHMWLQTRLLAFAVASVLLALPGCKQDTPKGEDAATEAAEASPSQESSHLGFDSPEAALEAFVAAAEADDVEALTRMLGPGGEPMIKWGDPVGEKSDRREFVEMYRAKHQLVDGDDGETIIELGDESWPFPAPLEERGGKWYFDGEGGAEELVYRRIGQNELGAIAVAHGFVDAEYEYASKRHDGNIAGLYAPFLISDPGRQNGLYWPVEGDEPESPAGPFIAAAAGEGYRRAASGEPTPYHGYFYRMLYAQGKHAQGGAKDYFEAGRMVRGFALIAWPAEYGVSGVKTFIVNQDDVVYEKDMGDDTAALASDVRLFDPDDSWNAVDPG